MRSVIFAAALAALFVLVLRPVCDAYAAGAAHGSALVHDAQAHEHAPGAAGHAGTEGQCCARLDETAPVKSLERALVPQVQPALAVEAGPSNFAPPGHAGPARIARGDPSPPRPYYARTARILR